MKRVRLFEYSSFDNMEKAEAAERRPILHSSIDDSTHRAFVGDSYQELGCRNDDHEEKVGLSRHITLPYAVMIMIGNVIGSGIFLSPTGVTANVGSVGGSLLIWIATGFYSLAQALCYAELGTLIPRAGGDYAYVHAILGPLPAFMLLWVNLIIVTGIGGAVVTRTAGLYLLEPLGLQCNLYLITVLAVAIIGE